MELPMPVKAGQCVEELAKNGVGLPILGCNHEEPTEISVHCKSGSWWGISQSSAWLWYFFKMPMLVQRVRKMSQTQMELN